MPRRILYSVWGKSYYLFCKEKLKGLQFDIIHAHQVYPDGYAACLFKNVTKKPVVVTIHGELSNPELSSYLVKRKVKYALTHADKIIIIGKYQKKLCRNFGLRNTNKLVNIPNGFDKDMFFQGDVIQARRELSIPEDAKVLTYVGHLYPPKGLSYLINAMKLVINEEKEILLYIVGDGPMKNELVNLTFDLGLSRNIVFVGQKERRDIRKWMNASDLFVLPSIKEGFPTVIPEALACGKPVVSTNIFGIPDIINNEKTGILVPPGNSEELATAIIKALNTKWDSKEILRRVQDYSWQSISKRLLECYEQVYFNSMDCRNILSMRERRKPL